MKTLTRCLAGLVLGVLAALLGSSASAQSFIGKPLPKVELESLHQSNASSLEDFTGRALLIEFFAEW
jgi:hypothetical protein